MVNISKSCYNCNQICEQASKLAEMESFQVILHMQKSKRQMSFYLHNVDDT